MCRRCARAGVPAAPPSESWAQLAVEIEFASSSTAFVCVLLDGSLVAEVTGIATTDTPAAETR